MPIKTKQQKYLSSQEKIETPAASVGRMLCQGFFSKGVIIGFAFAGHIPLNTLKAEPMSVYKQETAEEKSIQFDIPAQDLAHALSVFTVQSHIQVLYEGNIAKNLRSTTLKGAYTPAKALPILLTGTPIQARFTGNRTLTLERKAAVLPSVNNTDSTTLPMVKVTGKATYDPHDPYNQDYSVSNAATATKTDTPVMETPFSVQVLPEVVLKDQQSIQLQEVLRNVSGVNTYNAEGLVGGAIATMRGFEVNQYYRDGFPIPANNNPARRETASLERIEVLKGPGSLLYGRVDPGGVINTVTKQPLATPFYSLQQQFGSFDLYRTTADATGPLTRDGSLLYRMNLAYESSGSFVRFGHDDHIFLAPVLRWNITDRTQLTLYAEYLNDEKVPNNGFGVPAIGKTSNRPAPVSMDFTKLNPWNRVKSESGLAGLHLTHSFNDDWKLDYQFSTFLSRHTRLLTFGGYVNPTTYRLGRFSSDSGNDVDSYFTALNVTGHFDTWGLRHTLLAGTDYYNSQNTGRTNSFKDTPLDIFNPVYNLSEPVRNLKKDKFSTVRTEWNGVYLQDQVDLPYSFHLIAGGRYDNVRISQGGSLGTGNIDMGTVKPRVGLLWRPMSEISVYGSYTENLGTVGVGGDSTIVNPDGSRLKPEQAQQWETGVKTELFGGRLIGSLAFYQLTKQNIATPHTDPVLNGLGYFLSIGKARSQGIEVDVSGEILPGWNVIASYAYTDTKILSDMQDSNSYQKIKYGNQLPNVPKHGGSLWSTYRFQEGPLSGFKFGAGTYIRGQREGDAANSLQLPGYVTVNLMAGYEWKVGPSVLSAQFNVENLLDKEYFQQSSGRAGSMFGSPRAYMGSVRVSF